MLKHILVPVSGEASGAAAALCALNLGQKLKAHVTAGYAAVPPRVFTSAIEGDVAAWDERFYQSLQDIRDGRRKSARRDFDIAVAHTKVPIATRPLCAQASTEWLDGARDDSDPVGELGPLADLVVLPVPGNRRNSDWDLVENVLFAARRPALVIPQACGEVSFAKPLIAWNGSIQAANAARAALDLLDDRSQIVVLQVGDLCAGGISAARLADNLGWHCFESRTLNVDDVPHQTGAIILDQARLLGATVIILGAYGHSRTRELILGGVTDFLLRQSTLPLLLVH
ncbi:MAG: universal stress protein [Nitrospira sp.]|nr:universal stress protein [Nitrospira sp.]MBX7198238.1 universal stress protein [Rhodospirillaceae bacterium]